MVFVSDHIHPCHFSSLCHYCTLFFSIFVLLFVESFPLNRDLLHHLSDPSISLIFFLPPFNFLLCSWDIVPDVFSFSSPLSLSLTSQWHLIPQQYCHCISSFVGSGLHSFCLHSFCHGLLHSFITRSLYLSLHLSPTTSKSLIILQALTSISLLSSPGNMSSLFNPIPPIIPSYCNFCSPVPVIFCFSLCPSISLSLVVFSLAWCLVSHYTKNYWFIAYVWKHISPHFIFFLLLPVALYNPALLHTCIPSLLFFWHLSICCIFSCAWYF